MENKKIKKKSPLMYAITPDFENEIRTYVDGVHRKTGLPKSRIVSNVLLEMARNAKKICSKISENSETVSDIIQEVQSAN